MEMVKIFDEPSDYAYWVNTKDRLEIISVVVFKDTLVVTYKTF